MSLKYTILLFALGLLYVWLGPKIEQRFNVRLPGLPGEQVGQYAPNNDRSLDFGDAEAKPGAIDPARLDELLKDVDGGQSTRSESLTSRPDTGPTTDGRSEPSTQSPGSTSPAAVARTESTPKPRPQVAETPSSQPKLKLGDLREIDRNRFESAAGILYTPGSAEGHRIDHLMRHTKDDTSRPVHGVFDGGRQGALATIDHAFLKVLRGDKGISKRTEGGRTVYIVDMGKRVGFIGGQKGQRQDKPAARKVQIVLEDGNRLITAYPR